METVRQIINEAGFPAVVTNLATISTDDNNKCTDIFIPNYAGVGRGIALDVTITNPR